MGLRRIAAVLIVAPLMALGCYSPNIGEGNYACGSDGGCPDKFHCASDHRCYQKADASIEMPPPVCTSDASAPQVCSALPASGQACNPGCQTGCGCGWCAVVNGATKCLTGKAGLKDVGALCDPSLESDCAAGLYCQPECGAGRCYRFCDSSGASACGTTGSACSVTARKPGDAGGALSFTLCSLVSTCDAVSQKGCDAPFACYPTGKTNPSTVCECAGSLPTLQGCSFTDQCVRGDNCIGFGMTAQAMCLQTCVTPADCSTGTCQNPMPMYGYCL
jgi:hypothetical protein